MLSRSLFGLRRKTFPTTNVNHRITQSLHSRNTSKFLNLNNKTFTLGRNNVQRLPISKLVVTINNSYKVKLLPQKKQFSSLIKTLPYNHLFPMPYRCFSNSGIKNKLSKDEYKHVLQKMLNGTYRGSQQRMMSGLIREDHFIYCVWAAALTTILFIVTTDFFYRDFFIVLFLMGFLTFSYVFLIAFYPIILLICAIWAIGLGLRICLGKEM